MKLGTLSPIPRTRIVAFGLLTGALLSAAPVSAQCTAQEVKMLLASDAAAADNLGLSISVHGDTAVVGAWLEDNANGTDAGAAYVYQRDFGGTDNWGEVQKLVASDGATLDAFGWSVHISGDRVVVGSYRVDGAGANRGAAYVFERDSGGTNNWGEVAKLTASNAADDDQFGFSVSVSGDTIAVGAHVTDALGVDSGSAYVYDKDNGGTDNWGEVTEITAVAGAAGDSFGRSIDIAVDTIVVGAFLDGDKDVGAGAAYVFERDLGGTDNWGQIQQILASDGVADDNFGSSISISGDLVSVGSPSNDSTGVDAGAAYVYGRDVGGTDNWGEVAKLIGSETSKNDVFGSTICIDGDTVVVGSYSDNSGAGNNSGLAYVFGADWGGVDNWGQSHKLIPSDAALQDRFGWSVGVSGTTVVSGATHNDDGGTNAGSGYVFGLVGLPVAYCTAGTSASGCVASISSTGTPSETLTSGFSLLVTAAEGGKNGVFFFGANGRQANPWGSGTSKQCVVTPVRRAGLINGTGTTGNCDGTFTQDFNALWCPTCPKPQKNYGAGARVQAQLWYRDPANTSNQSTSLSDALEFTICP